MGPQRHRLVMRLQARECQGVLAAPTSQDPPWSLRGECGLADTWFQTSSLQIYKRINFCCLKPLSLR